MYGCWQLRISTNKTIVIIEKICFFPNQKPPSAFSLAHPSNDTPGSNVPPKIPARSKTPLRSVKKGTPDATADESAAGGARKQKGGGGGQAPPHGDAVDAALPAGTTNAASGKEAKKAEAVPENPLPAVKTVPPSPKVYVRKVKGKGKKEPKS